MHLRVARHTNNLEKMSAFYIDILGLELIGCFKNHNHYDGIFLGKPNLNWHLEFTQSNEKVNQTFDEDAILVFYPITAIEYNALIHNILKNNIAWITPKNPYWKDNGIMIMDPDGYRIVISNSKIV